MIYGVHYETFSWADEAEEAVLEDDGVEETDDGWVPACPTVKSIMENAKTAGEMCDLLKAHRLQCAVCLSEKKDVVSDREALGTKDSVCCGEVA